MRRMFEHFFAIAHHLNCLPWCVFSFSLHELLTLIIYNFKHTIKKIMIIYLRSLFIWLVRRPFSWLYVLIGKSGIIERSITDSCSSQMNFMLTEGKQYVNQMFSRIKPKREREKAKRLFQSKTESWNFIRFWTITMKEYRLQRVTERFTNTNISLNLLDTVILW